VESDGAQETVKGAVIERDSGRSLLAIDLFQQLDQPAVVAKDTHPFLSSAANGDILVGWLEPDGNGGFDVKAALYKAAGQDTWTLPDKVLDLHHFASEPKDFSVGLGGDGEPQIQLTWEMDSHSGAWAQQFDLAGADLGARYAIGDAHSDAASDTTSLPDGRIVVVYAEQDSNGNLALESHVVVSGDGAQVASPDSGSGSSSPDIVISSLDSGGSSPDSGGSSLDSGGSSLDSGGSSTNSGSSDVIFGDRGTLDTHAGLGDYGSLSTASQLATDKDITVVEDATDGVIIDVVNDQDGGLRVIQVNGADLALGAPLRIEHGFVQLRDDGDLLFTADENFHGTVNFAYTVSTDDDQLATASVAINVTPHEDDPMPVDLAFDQAASETHTTSELSAPPPDHQTDAGQPDAANANSGPGSLGDANASSTSGGDAQHIVSDASHSGGGTPEAASSTSGGSGDSSGSAPTQPLEASLAGLDDPSDTISLAPRYENTGDKVERQWLQLDYNPNSGYAASYTPDGSQEGAGHENDTFVFHAAFGNDATPESPGDEHAIDLSKSGYPTFQALQDAGALVQVGADVEITLNVADPAHPEKILLRSVSLSTLTPHDFKFS
jgi:Cadherin-like domain